MDPQELREKALEELRCANLGGAKQLEEVLDEFIRPLQERHDFVAGVGTFVLARIGSLNHTTKMPLSVQHAAVYSEVLLKKLQSYRSLVEGNKARNQFYKIPAFDAEQAREFAREAVVESFERARESYRKQ